MKKIVKIIYSFIILLFFSCNDSDLVKEYNDDGNLIKEYEVYNDKKNGVYKEYNADGKLKTVHIYKDDVAIDTSSYYQNGILKQVKYWDSLKNNSYFEKIFSKNGNVISYGRRLTNGVRIHKWPILNKEGIKVSETEYFNYKGEEYVNQIYHFKENDTLFNKGNFYHTLPIKDTLFVGEKFKLYFFLRGPVFGYKSSLKMIVPRYKKGFNFNNDFSNIEKIEKDTVYSINHYIDDNDEVSNQITTTLYSFKKPGLKNLRIILNEYLEHENRDDNLSKEERLIFFEKEIFVKNSIE